MAYSLFKGAVGFDRNSPEVFENAVASLVDMASILFAYQLGMNGFGIGMGVLYAMFDAFIVIWMRKPIARFARWISPYRIHSKSRPPETKVTPGLDSSSQNVSTTG